MLYIINNHKKNIMKNLDLNSFGVEEMNEEVMENLNGGNWGLALSLAALAIYCYDNRDRFCEGFADAW